MRCFKDMVVEGEVHGEPYGSNSSFLYALQVQGSWLVGVPLDWRSIPVPGVPRICYIYAQKLLHRTFVCHRRPCLFGLKLFISQTIFRVINSLIIYHPSISLRLIIRGQASPSIYHQQNLTSWRRFNKQVANEKTNSNASAPFATADTCSHKRPTRTVHPELENTPAPYFASQ